VTEVIASTSPIHELLLKIYPDMESESQTSISTQELDVRLKYTIDES
jgi:hypothetical protein